MTSSSDSPSTLLSAVQRFRSLEALPNHAHHPFATSSEESSTLLQELLDTLDRLSHSLNSYSSAPMSNPKLVSILRQHGAMSHSLYLISERTISQTIEMLRNRPATSYGEDIPLDKTLIAEWCIARVEAWAASVGMETFRDEQEGRVVVVLGGKVLVVDVDFAVNNTDPLTPRIDVAGVKTSYAFPNGVSSPTTESSTSLEALLAGSIQSFCAEVQRNEDSRQPQEAARLGKLVVGHLSYLMTLDKLAFRKEDGGIRWFADLHQLGLTAENIARSEALSVASSLSVSHAPLDVYLLRSHALPLPYLTSPSISFLTYVSTQAYLSLLHISPPLPPVQANSGSVPIDIPLSHLRQHLSAYPHLRGTTIARLTLTPVSNQALYPSAMSMPTLDSRPTFPLSPIGPDIDHSFPQCINTSASLNDEACKEESTSQHTWILDFTEGGKYSGVVMSQSRMRDIELVVNPFSVMNQMNAIGMMSFGTGSWVDLLLNPTNPVSPERYTTLYRSPTAAHPPLQLRLISPEEPGFFLERVRVQNLKEVWAILEIVREQCWLNEILNGCQWVAEGLATTKFEVAQEGKATAEELQAVLNGTVIPRKIPVNIYLPSQSDPSHTFFDTTTLDAMSMNHMQTRRPRIVMTSPERPPISGLVEITVAYDETRPRGIGVEIRGALGTDFKADVLEEVCRRGGTLGLSGKVWQNAHGSS